uniref:Uncharacterized protein n=1 Tax=Gossypium raimondii TaxID=29730 RepID=A0A0D2Q3K6_GOSRA|nr:hypothetical protein B456_006G051600 [Gossypium raimondii]
MEQSLGSSGVRRATKKVRRRDDDPLDVGDMETDDGGSKVASFKDKLLGWVSNESVKEDYEEDEFELLDADVLTKTMNGISNIKFSERVHTLIQKTTAKTMIIKFLGRKIGFNNMVSKPHILWKVRRTIYGQYLTVKSCFSRSIYKKCLLEAVGNSISQVIKMDNQTENRMRGHFVRMPVLVEGKIHRVEYEAYRMSDLAVAFMAIRRRYALSYDERNR